MDLIRDPLDETQALTAKGALAMRAFFVPKVADVNAPTLAELADSTFVGWVDPDELNS